MRAVNPRPQYREWGGEIEKSLAQEQKGRHLEQQVDGQEQKVDGQEQKVDRRSLIVDGPRRHSGAFHEPEWGGDGRETAAQCVWRTKGVPQGKVQPQVRNQAGDGTAQSKRTKKLKSIPKSTHWFI